MRTVGHAFGVEGVKFGVIEEIDRLNALAAAYLNKSKMEIEVLQVVITELGLLLLTH